MGALVATVLVVVLLLVAVAVALAAFTRGVTDLGGTVEEVERRIDGFEP